MNEETKRKISATMVGHVVSEETRRKMGASTKGRTNYWWIGKKHSNKTKLKISKAKTGKKCSQETKDKMSEAKLNNPLNRFKRMIRETNVLPDISYVPRVRSRKHSEETKQKLRDIAKRRWQSDTSRIQMSIINGGDGDIDRLNTKDRTDRDVKWAKRVYKRDRYICQFCSGRNQNGRVNAHHIFRKSLFPKLRYLINNGVTLCEECHEKIRGLETEMIKYFQQVHGLAVGF